MSDPYAFRPGGSLKLKRTADDGEGPAKKKKKSSSKSKKDKIKEGAVDKSALEAVESSNEPGSSKAAADEGDTEADGKTAAEKKFEESQRKRREEKVRRMATKTHKDRVHEFNSKLEALSEHHDIPKVGPG
ncbi:hypothetical protein M407DRAFT_242652 [Tulasnella calospora MUT 4182]|uniref:DUF1754-domain-containing protein n=1 Tax=Tulasnella calospora MUT 4182 TaxID=1051891 RepID=A0A0C3QPK8_9AGAM|nr:hypothetical protein M407DRAFT_242652 [Tulasnella calospora MUT 4182]